MLNFDESESVVHLIFESDNVFHQLKYLYRQQPSKPLER